MSLLQAPRSYRLAILRFVALAGILLAAACTQGPTAPPATVVVSVVPSETPTDEPTETPPPTMTSSPTSAPTPPPPTPTKLPVTPTASAPNRLNVVPASVRVPAGASASFVVGVTGRSTPASAPHWSVGSLPKGVTAGFIQNAVPMTSTLVVDTPCALANGSYALDVQAAIPQLTQSSKARLDVGPRLVETTPGAFTGWFTGNTIDVRKGGPSTLRSGPFLVLQFCESNVRRRGVVRIQSATSEAGTTMNEPPPFTLFKILTWPVPDYLQTNEPLYANAREIASNTGWSLEWNITNGVYMVAFLRSPFDTSKPAGQRPASVKYNFNVVR